MSNDKCAHLSVEQRKLIRNKKRTTQKNKHERKRARIQLWINVLKRPFTLGTVLVLIIAPVLIYGAYSSPLIPLYSFDKVKNEVKRVVVRFQSAVNQDKSFIKSTVGNLRSKANLTGGNNSSNITLEEQATGLSKSLGFFEDDINLKLQELTKELNAIAAKVDSTKLSKGAYLALLDNLDSMELSYNRYKKVTLDAIVDFNQKLAMAGYKADTEGNDGNKKVGGELATTFRNAIRSINMIANVEISDSGISGVIMPLQAKVASFVKDFNKTEEKGLFETDENYKTLVQGLVELNQIDNVDNFYRAALDFNEELQNFDVDNLTSGSVSSLSKMLHDSIDDYKVGKRKVSDWKLIPAARPLYSPYNEFKQVKAKIKNPGTGDLQLIVSLVMTLIVAGIVFLRVRSAYNKFDELQITRIFRVKSNLAYREELLASEKDELDKIAKDFLAYEQAEEEALRTALQDRIDAKAFYDDEDRRKKIDLDELPAAQEQAGILEELAFEAKQALDSFLFTTPNAESVFKDDYQLNDLLTRLKEAQAKKDQAWDALQKAMLVVNQEKEDLSSGLGNRYLDERLGIAIKNKCTAKRDLDYCVSDVADIRSEIAKRKKDLTNQFNKEKVELETALSKATAEHNKQTKKVEKILSDLKAYEDQTFDKQIAECEAELQDFLDSVETRQSDAIKQQLATIDAIERSIVRVQEKLDLLQGNPVSSKKDAESSKSVSKQVAVA